MTKLEIDHLVYHLYGLTEEEIRIVPACKNGFTHEENLRFYLDFCSLIRTFAGKNNVREKK